MNDVTFRRINGRIVPIKRRGISEDGKKGVGLVAAGLAVTIAGASLAGKLGLVGKVFASKSRIFSEGGLRAMSVKNYKLGGSRMMKAAEYYKGSKKLFKASKATALISPIIGAALIDSGLDKIDRNSSAVTNTATSTITSGATFFAANKIIKKIAFPFLR